MQGCGSRSVPVDDCHVSMMGPMVTGGGWVQPLTIYHTTLVRIGDWRSSTFGVSNHKSTRATPGSFASQYIIS